MLGLERKRLFERLMLPHLPALYRLSLRLCRDEPAAEDLVQDAIVKAFRFFDRFELGSNERAWLYRLTVNLFYNHYRQQKRQQQLLADAAQPSLLHRFVSRSSLESTGNPEQHALDQLTGERLRAALDALPEDFRVAVILCDVEGLSYREISDVLECPMGTVMSRIYRGRRMLREAVDTEIESDGTLISLEHFRHRRGEE